MKEEISVRCHTYLDDYKTESWPDKFCCRPMIGEYVESEKSQVCLRIVKIIHCGTYLFVELGK